MFSGYELPKFEGQKFLDGGFTNNLPILEESTITVSPFAGDIDICPNDDEDMSEKMKFPVFGQEKLTLSRKNFKRFNDALKALSGERLDALFQDGYNDTKRFVENNGIENKLSHTNDVKS